MSLSLQSLQTSLEPLVQVRPAEEGDSVASVRPQVVVEPATEEEVAAVLSFANKEGLHVLIRGGGTQLGLGFPPQGGDILLSTARLNKIVEHAPSDLVVTVEAGLPLSALQSALQQSKQWLALDPELPPEATIGGVVATNASGARRLRYGGVRDAIIGIRVVLADGTIAKGGGKVVKNVAGYDLPKLFTGALGTLGVVVSATFRLYPLPIASGTVCITSSSIASLSELAVRIIGSTLVPTIIDIFGNTTHPKGYTMAVRFEMSQEAAEAQAASLLAMITEVDGATIKAAQLLEGHDEVQFWSRGVPDNERIDTTGTVVSLKASLLPTEVGCWLAFVEQVCQQRQLQATWRAHAGHGIVFVQLAGDDKALLPAIAELREAVLPQHGSLVVTDAPLPLTQQIDVWGPVPALDVMRNLKARFDPNGVLNRGRFVGGL